MTHNHIQNKKNDGYDIFRTLTSQEEVQAKELLQKKWSNAIKVQNVMSEEEQERTRKILSKKWFFQRPLHGFPLEKPAHVVEDFMKKRFFSVEPNVYRNLTKQDETMNSLMAEDREWYFSMMSGEREVAEGKLDDGNEQSTVSALSEQQTNELKKLLQSEREANRKYLEEHPEVEGIVGVLYSNLCYYRPPDPAEFVKTLFGSCELCLRGNISSYLKQKDRAKRVDPFAAIASSRQLTDWRKVAEKLADNERIREEEDNFRRFVDEGNEDELTKAYKKVVKKKHSKIATDVINNVLDEIISKGSAAEEKIMIETVGQIIELVIDEIFGDAKTEEDVRNVREKSKEISETLTDTMLSEVLKGVRRDISVEERKSQMIANVIEIVTEQVIKEVEDKEVIKMLEENKSNMILQIIESVMNKIFGEPRKPEDRLTFTQLDVIIEATDKIMRSVVDGNSCNRDFIF